MTELRGAVHPAALRLGDLAEQRDDGGDGGAGGGAQALGAGLRRWHVLGEPGAQRGPAAAPVVALFVAARNGRSSARSGQAQHGIRIRAARRRVGIGTAAASRGR